MVGTLTLLSYGTPFLLILLENTDRIDELT